MKILSAKTKVIILHVREIQLILSAICKSDLTNINNDDNWSFAMLHEIGHNFDFDNWNFDGEFWANFKMYYVMSQSVTIIIRRLLQRETDFI